MRTGDFDGTGIFSKEGFFRCSLSFSKAFCVVVVFVVVVFLLLFLICVCMHFALGCQEDMPFLELFSTGSLGLLSTPKTVMCIMLFLLVW